MTNLYRVLLAAFISLSIVGCSGGSKSSTSLTPAGSNTNTTKSGPASTTVTMVIPKAIATQSKSRSPQYISPSTLGVAVYVFIPPATQPSTPTAVADFSATSPACTAGSNGSRTCTITVPAPIGNNDTFVVSTYDQVPAGGQPQGNLLSTNTILGVVITAGSVNTVPLTLNGVPATIVMNPPAVQVPAGQANSFTINVNAKDVDGNYIIGTGTYTNAISLAITGDPNHTLSLSSSTVSAPSGSAINVTFTGGSLGTGIITATATGATSATTTITASNAVSQVTFTIPGFSSEAVYLAEASIATIARFASNASGAATPTFTIVGGVPIGIAVDAANEYVLGSNLSINIYPIGAVAGPPATTISGSNTHMCNPVSIAVYSGTIYLADTCAGVLEYPTTASGNAANSQQITGSNTGITSAGSIAVSSSGIYVGNRGSNATLLQFSLGAGGNVSPALVIPSGSGSFNASSGVEGLAADPSGNVYVTSGGSNNNVVVFAPGATTASYAISGNGTFCAPQGIALDGLNHIWVANDCWGTAPNDEVIQGFTLGSGNANNSPIVTFGGFASINYSRAGCCASIAVDPSNNIYSANQGINTVSQFNQSGTVLTTLVYGPNGAITTPAAITFDSGGNLFVANPGVGTVSVYAPGQTTPNRKFFAPPPNNPCSLLGIAVDAAGHAFTADNCNNTLTEYPANSSSSTTPLLTLSGGGSGLSGPHQINFDNAGNLYVANANNNTITIYGNGLLGNGTPTATIGGGSTTLNDPTGVAIDPAGYVYVLNNNPGSVSVFAPGTTGNVAPVRTITGLSNGTGQLAVDQFQNVYVNTGGGFSVWGPTANGSVSPNVHVNYAGYGQGIAISPTQP